MAARLQNFLIWLTALLLLAVAALSLRSVWVVDQLLYIDAAYDGKTWTIYDIRTTFGDIFFARVVRHAPPLDAIGLSYASRPTSNLDRPQHTFIGFATRPLPGGRGVSFPMLAVVVPPLLITVVVHLRVSRQLRARQRLAAGLCIACGYDLRGSPERCPECGELAVITLVGK